MASTDSPWQTIIAAALLGSERQPFQPPIAPGQLGQVLSQLCGRSTEAALLSAAATVTLHHRVGWLPETQAPDSIEPVQPDDLPRCNPLAARYLQQILQGQYSSLLSEWLEKAAQTEQRVPEMLLPALLDKGRQQRELRALILPVLGHRGRWLAAQNPDWSYAIALSTETDWETSTPAARLLYLQDLRSHDPDRARELVQATWSQETASDRVKFLETFRIGLSLADESFLESALGDRRSKEVRRVAFDLLASLPDSRLCQQITEHTCRYLSLQDGKVPALKVLLPEQLDKSLLQLGLELKPSTAVNSTLGEKAWWLLQLIGATPLSTWTEQWQMSPQAILKMTQSHEWQTVLLHGFVLAAKRQKNAEWLEVIFKRCFREPDLSREIALVGLSIEELFNMLPAASRDDLLIYLLQIAHTKIKDSLTIWLLRYSPQQWSVDLAQLVLTCLEEQISATTNFSNSDWELRATLKEFARFIPVSLIPEVMQLRIKLLDHTAWIQSIDDLLTLLQFRYEMTQSFEAGSRR
ncbi:MAG TPA: hypothetical protein IGS53_20415 [Leptolyngbyaceae cyanobacterium M33_DOE_097]|uniref:Uncharacterized protein n=1 Tax=Oscillatoriales cyanobacterium SpSt-418 TaxID=2282169 RepID=A0A7C3KFR6_9CYAN|nr:hypothetical protein [Leptolyngbyaceae cyanobacterium M33_DOE_097]